VHTQQPHRHLRHHPHQCTHARDHTPLQQHTPASLGCSPPPVGVEELARQLMCAAHTGRSAFMHLLVVLLATPGQLRLQAMPHLVAHHDSTKVRGWSRLTAAHIQQVKLLCTHRLLRWCAMNHTHVAYNTPAEQPAAARKVDHPTCSIGAGATYMDGMGQQPRLVHLW
jgi:hypothetical protein